LREVGAVPGVDASESPASNTNQNQELETLLALPESRSLAVGIASRLRAAILGGHFGPGERLREEVLARSMGVSRGPVREALARLEREGLVVIRHNRGAFVGQLSREDLEEVHTLRVVLERLAVQRTALLGDAALFAEMQTVVDEMASLADRGITEQEAAELDVRFHDLIYRGSAHRRLQECWANLSPQVHIVLLSRNVAHEDFRDYLVGSHQAILDALRERDEPRALAILDDHLRGSYERVVLSHARRLTPDRATAASTNQHQNPASDGG
jgi:DNA-binding GntR family transcriptional regulator